MCSASGTTTRSASPRTTRNLNSPPHYTRPPKRTYADDKQAAPRGRGEHSFSPDRGVVAVALPGASGPSLDADYLLI
jgi:hypothetical protein